MSAGNLDIGDEYEVEKILDSRVRRGKRYYLVRWKGFDSSEDSWEPASNLKHCQDVLKEFKIENTPVKRLSKGKLANRRTSGESSASIETSSSNKESENLTANVDKNHKNINQVQRESRESTPLTRIKAPVILSPGQFKEVYGRYPDINEVKENVRKRSLAKLKGEITPELFVAHKKPSDQDLTKFSQTKFLIIYLVVALIALLLIFYLTDVFQLLNSLDNFSEEVTQPQGTHQKVGN